MGFLLQYFLHHFKTLIQAQHPIETFLQSKGPQFQISLTQGLNLRMAALSSGST